MSARVLRDFRRQTAKAAELAASKVQPGIQAALGNEQLTRGRVDALERSMAQDQREMESIREALSAFMHMGFWERLKWQLLGR